MAIENRLYEAKDLLGFLQLKPEKIYLWLRTYRIFEPAERPRGIRGKNKYSLLDLVKLSLIANLQSLGIPLEHIQKIFSEVNKAGTWKQVVNERDRIETEGAILLIIRETGIDWYRLRVGTGSARPQPTPRFRAVLLSNSEAQRQLEESLKAPWPILAINLSFIVKNVESIAGDKLGN